MALCRWAKEIEYLMKRGKLTIYKKHKLLTVIENIEIPTATLCKKYQERNNQIVVLVFGLLNSRLVERSRFTHKLGRDIRNVILQGSHEFNLLHCWLRVLPRHGVLDKPH